MCTIIYTIDYLKLNITISTPYYVINDNGITVHTRER